MIFTALEHYETAAAPYRTEHPSKKPVSTYGQPSSPTFSELAGSSQGNCDCKTCASTCKKPPKEEDDDRQASIDFENQIQDLVYVRNPVESVETAETADTAEKQRTKRDINANASFINTLENLPSTENATVHPTKEQNVTNDQGEYTQFSTVLYNPTKLSLDLTNLRHFTSYLISVSACREITLDDAHFKPMPGLSKPDPCSIPTQVTILTAKKDDADEIKFFDVANLVPSNESYGIVKVSWKAPEHPNGLLLSYNIKYRKNEVENAHWDGICIPHQNYLNQTFYLLKPLSNGKPPCQAL